MSFKSALDAMVGTKLYFLYRRGLFCCFACDVDDSASEYSGYPFGILGIWCWTLSYALPEAIVVLALLLNLLIGSNHFYRMMYRRNILPNHQILVEGPHEMIHDLQSCHDKSISSIVSLEPPCMP